MLLNSYWRIVRRKNAKYSISGYCDDRTGCCSQYLARRTGCNETQPPGTLRRQHFKASGHDALAEKQAFLNRTNSFHGCFP